MSDVMITEKPAMTLVGMHHRGPYSEMGVVYQKVAGIISEHGLWHQTQGAIGTLHANVNIPRHFVLRARARRRRAADAPRPGTPATGSSACPRR